MAFTTQGLLTAELAMRLPIMECCCRRYLAIHGVLLQSCRFMCFIARGAWRSQIPGATRIYPGSQISDPRSECESAARELQAAVGYRRGDKARSLCYVGTATVGSQILDPRSR